MEWEWELETRGQTVDSVSTHIGLVKSTAQNKGHEETVFLTDKYKRNLKVLSIGVIKQP